MNKLLSRRLHAFLRSLRLRTLVLTVAEGTYLVSGPDLLPDDLRTLSDSLDVAFLEREDDCQVILPPGWRVRFYRSAARGGEAR